MREKILEFLGEYLHKVGDCCPCYRLEEFINIEFQKDDRAKAIDIIQQWIKDGDLIPITENNEKLISITAIGIKMLKEN